MKIEHIAFWVKDLEETKRFYTTYFKLKSNEKYINSERGFESYFLDFEEETTRIEIMQMPEINENNQVRGKLYGYAHLAFSVGSKKEVDSLTERLRLDGYKIIGEPRTTGDGYYESVIEDDEGNWIEITV
ncbi:VOC family protein [Empedobacter brevis]|uniref:VOC family protein n=1 Tax=Empedobacter brevis TaxID=247 RepID=UPI002899A3EF|nr:VOC family protein [Empedobacter brevis]